MGAVDLGTVFTPLDFRLFVAIIVIGAVGGIAYDAIGRKKIAAYRYEIEWKRGYGRGNPTGESGAHVFLRVLFGNILSSGEIASCNDRHLDSARRGAHILLFYGLILAVISMLGRAAFFPTLNAYPISNPWVLATEVGYAMFLAGGLSMLFFRVNVRSEMNSMGHTIRADMFILSMVAASIMQFILFAADWSGSTIAAHAALYIFIPVTAFPFLSMAWSKFPHIVYKPAFALRRELDEAMGYSHLPSPSKDNFIKKQAR